MCALTPKIMEDWLQEMKKVMPRYDQEFACEKALRARYSGSTYDSPRSVRAPSPSPTELEGEQQEIDELNTSDTTG